MGRLRELLQPVAENRGDPGVYLKRALKLARANPDVQSVLFIAGNLRGVESSALSEELVGTFVDIVSQAWPEMTGDEHQTLRRRVPESILKRLPQ